MLQTPNKSCRSLEGFNVHVCHVVVVNQESQDTGCSLQSSVPRREEPCRAVPCLNLVSASDCLTITYDVGFRHFDRQRHNLNLHRAVNDTFSNN